MAARISHWIDGKPWAGVAERTGEVFDPATGEVSGHVDFAVAVRSRRGGRRRRRGRSPPGATPRSRPARGCCSRSASCCNEHKDDLAAIVTAEHGKVLDDAGGEVQRALENVEFACGIPALLKGGFSENASTRSTSTRCANPSAWSA